MAADLRIADGNPIWASQSIIPSRDSVVSPGSSPSLAAVAVNATGIHVYVKVENTGSVDFGVCSCAATGAWPAEVLFGGFFGDALGSTSKTQAGVTFKASPAGDSLTGPDINYVFGVVASGRRAWAWSPDGRFFAYVKSSSGTNWYLTIVALQSVTRPTGTVVPKGQAAISGLTDVFKAQWNNTNFGWAGSRAVTASAPAAGGGILRYLACPEAPPGSNSWSELVPDFPGQIGWTYRSSPCGSVVAIVPKILKPVAGSREAFLVSAATATRVPFKSNNVQKAITITGSNPSITTVQHAANGLRIDTGGGGVVNADDPDCTVVGGGVVVWVDRVKATTLPTANVGVMAIGSGVAGLVKVGTSVWIQAPNSNPSGWANQGERHWCLLAHAYTSDGTTIPRPWNGQAQSPSPFPVMKNNCAQRNIEISP